MQTRASGRERGKESEDELEMGIAACHKKRRGRLGRRLGEGFGVALASKRIRAKRRTLKELFELPEDMAEWDGWI